MSNVIFTSTISEEVQRQLEQVNWSKLAIIVDENTEIFCLPLLNLHNEAIVIKTKSGEEYKNLETCSIIWKALTDAQFDRKSLVVNLGGGVIGDMGGFCASTYKRGLRFINVPTTLLSQVDASVGGKLGIDFNGFKNHIGLFNEPLAVIIDDSFLKTLPERELKSGFAEVIKHHLIADKNGWKTLLSSDYKSLNWQNLINHSVGIKQSIVKEDPTESGKRKLLNFGHTIGHAIESYFLNTKDRLLHGEAIALGMICEAHISFQKGLLSETDLIEIRNYIFSIYQNVKIENEIRSELIELMGQDKKNSSSKILCVLLDRIGKAKWDVEINSKEINYSFDYLNQT